MAAIAIIASTSDIASAARRLRMDLASSHISKKKVALDL
jgi:hypothetical protein